MKIFIVEWFAKAQLQSAQVVLLLSEHQLSIPAISERNDLWLDE